MSVREPRVEISRRGLVLLLIIATAVGPFSQNVFIPSMPSLQRAFETDYGTAQLALSLFLVGAAVGQIIHGPLSDRFGRRPVVLGGLTLFLAASIVCALAPSVLTLVIGRFVQSVGGCVGMVVGRAMLRDLFDRSRMASIMAYLTMAMVLAPMVAPAIGGFLDVWLGWRAPFALLVPLGGVAMAAVWRWFPETHRPDPDSHGFRVYGAAVGGLFTQRRYLGYVFQVSFTTAAFFAFQGGAPYVMVELLGRPPSDFGLFILPVVASYMVGNLISARLVPRLGIDRLISIGTLIGNAAAVGLVAAYAAFGASPLLLFGGMAALSFTHGLCLPTGFAGAVGVDPKLAGAAAGLAGAVHMSIGALVSFVVGDILGDSATPVIAAMALMMAAGAVSHFVGVRPWKTDPALP